MTFKFRSSSRSEFAWPRMTTRQGESLWSLVHRFLWLNAPTWRDLECSFGCPSLASFSLLYGFHRLTPQGMGRHSFDRSRLARALSLPMRRWEAATLAWLRGTPVDDIVETMRFCPACLQTGYHTVVFQLVCVERCPLHGVPLVLGCPACGFALSADLDVAALSSPFACPQCGHSLASPECLVNPLPVDGQPLSRILAWYRRLGALPVIVPEPSTSGVGPVAFAPSWRYACLAMIDGHPAPTSVVLERKAVCAEQAVRVCCGIHLTVREAWDARGSMENSQRRHALIYKAYRRHIQKAMPRRNHRMMLAFVDGAATLWCPTSSVEEQHRRTAAWALLLFRSRMEGWPDIFTYGNPVLGRRQQERLLLSPALVGPRFDSRRCQPLSAEGRWLLDHQYAEAIRATFDEAVGLAKRMARRGRYRQSQEVSWGTNRPYSLGVCHDSGMEFRSWRRASLPVMEEG